MNNASCSSVCDTRRTGMCTAVRHPGQQYALRAYRCTLQCGPAARCWHARPASVIHQGMRSAPYPRHPRDDEREGADGAISPVSLVPTGPLGSTEANTGAA